MRHWVALSGRPRRGSRASHKAGPKCALLPLRACWRSSSLVTHGGVWLTFPPPCPTSSPPINSSCGPRRPPSWAATVGKPACTPAPTCVYLRWCTDQDLDPLALHRADVERYVRWLQDVRRYQPSTVSRRLSVVVGFYRVCVIDAILEHSPADYVRRPTVPAESPTLGLSHLQFEAPDNHGTAVDQSQRLRVDRAAGAARSTNLRSLRREHRRPGRGTRTPCAARPRQGRQGRPRPAATRSGPRYRPGRW